MIPLSLVLVLEKFYAHDLKYGRLPEEFYAGDKRYALKQTKGTWFHQIPLAAQ